MDRSRAGRKGTVAVKRFPPAKTCELPQLRHSIDEGDGCQTAFGAGTRMHNPENPGLQDQLQRIEERFISGSEIGLHHAAARSRKGKKVQRSFGPFLLEWKDR